MANLSSADCVQGWIEILHCKYESKDFNDATPLINHADLKTLKPEHYDLVGSTLPLCEYYCPFEIYQQFAVPVDSEFNMPRPFRPYDAINMCVNDPNYGSKITTLIVLPKDMGHTITYKVSRMQYHPKHKHCLVIRKSAFKSFILDDV